MTLRTILLGGVAAIALTGAASAQGFNDKVIENLRGLGYDFIEVKEGPTQSKFEGIDGDRKIEVIYDRATGQILKQEEGAADPDEAGRSGLEIDRDDDDFVDGPDDDADDRAEDRADREEDRRDDQLDREEDRRDDRLDREEDRRDDRLDREEDRRDDREDRRDERDDRDDDDRDDHDDDGRDDD